VRELEKRHAWDWVGPEAELIGEVLAGIDPDKESKLMKAWYAYMEEHLDFPFKAEVDEYQSRGPMRSGDRVRVLDLVMADDMYGLIVGLRHKRQHYDFPLGDLAVLDTRSENHRIVQAYRVWFANR
jgi:Holliday junction resolvase-like predicted endonuclease